MPFSTTKSLYSLESSLLVLSKDETNSFMSIQSLDFTFDPSFHQTFIMLQLFIIKLTQIFLIHKILILLYTHQHTNLLDLVLIKLQIIIINSHIYRIMYRKILEFVIYTLLIYSCYIVSGVYHQKILKHQYLNQKGQPTQFSYPIIFTFFPQVISAVIGYICLCFMKHVQSIQPKNIPFSKCIVCGIIINIAMATYNKAVIQASFPAVVMVKSCSLLSVIIVGIFCSRVKDKELMLGKSKIWIGLIVTAGIILFNYFKIIQKGNDKPITWYSSLLLLISLFGDGLLPDFQAQIKSLYDPSVMDMYYNINRCTALIAFIFSICTLQFFPILNFILQHKEFQTDLLYFSVLNAGGQLVIYKMIKLFKQHIPAFVIATRKCFTVIINILHFDHKINFYQLCGMSLVFAGVMVEVYENYKQKKQKETTIKHVDFHDNEIQREKLDIQSNEVIDHNNEVQVLDSKSNLSLQK